jgi:TniQ
VNARPLPFSPAPFPDEVLSSWIERIGIFYGFQYENALALLGAAMLLPPDRKVDVDTDPGMRKRVAEWAGRDLTSVPTTLNADDPGILDETARLTYCPRCWDDDVVSGRAPYIRRIWSRWVTVSCERHKTWLTARRPRLYRDSLRNGWEGVWQSNPQWAKAGNLKHDPLMAVTANAFAPNTFVKPDSDWGAFERAIKLIYQEYETRGVLEAGSVLGTVISPEFLSLRARVLASMQSQPPAIRLNDIDLHGYRRAEPGWIADRIVCLVIAVELVRTVSGSGPIFLGARAIIDGSECAQAWVSLARARPRASKVS